MRHFTIIGAGTIGTSIARAAIIGRVLTEERITFVETNPERCEDVATEFASSCGHDIPAMLSGVILLSVKPQDFLTLSKSLRGKFTADALVLSVMAGITTTKLEKALQHSRIVRMMSNTPLRVRRAATVWFASANIVEHEKQVIRALLSCLGYEQEVEEESLLDIATAISGSGPAYFFTFFQALVEAGVALGLSREQAVQWVRWTAMGSAALWEEEQGELSEMIQRVMSKGGTTEAALKELRVEELNDMWKDAVARAHARAKELSSAS